LSQRSGYIYSISAVETHTGKKKKAKRTKNTDEEERKMVIKPSRPEFKPLLDHYITPDDQSKEVFRYFSLHNVHHHSQLATEVFEVYHRVLNYFVYHNLAAYIFDKVPLPTEALSYAKTFLQDLSQRKAPTGVQLQNYFPVVYDYMAVYGTWEPGVHNHQGYPHIHITVFFSQPVDYISLRRLMRQVSGFEDTDAKGNCRSWKEYTSDVDVMNDARLIGYVVKNSRHGPTASRLGRYPVTVHHNNNPIIIDLYQRLLYKSYSEYPGKRIALNGVPRPEGPLRDPPDLPTYVPRSVGEQVIINEQEFLNPSTGTATEDSHSPLLIKGNSKHAAIRKIVIDLMEANGLLLVKLDPSHPYSNNPDRVEFYSKVSSSRNTYALWGGSNRFMNFLIKEDERTDLLTTNTPYIKSLFGTTGILPYIRMEYQWVELKDCFFHVNSGKICSTTGGKTCFLFAPHITKAMLPRIKDRSIYAETITELLQKQRVLDSDRKPVPVEAGNHDPKLFLRGLYNLTKSRRRKQHQIALYGRSNTAKSSFLDAFLSIYPRAKARAVTEDSKFALENCIGAEIIYTDEYSGTLPAFLLKLLLDGAATISVNRKGIIAIEVRPNSRVAFIGNDIKWAYTTESIQARNTALSNGNKHVPDFEIDPVYLARLAFFEFTQIIENPDIDKGSDMAGEAPLFLLQLATYYFENAFEEITTPEELKMILERDDAASQFDASTWKPRVKNQIIPPDIPHSEDELEVSVPLILS
jgi:hypothetical protein